MGFTIEGKNLMLDTFAGSAIFLGLADSNGDELVDGNYARQAITWETVADGSLECLHNFEFIGLAPDIDIASVIFMSDETGGIKLGDESAEGIVTYTIDGITVTI